MSGAGRSESYPFLYTPDVIKAALGTTIIGSRVELHRQVGSTNDVVREAARRGEREGLVVLAEEQVAGRGRLGRTWTTPPYCCVLCSVLLRPRFAPQHAFYLTVAASLAIYRAVRSLRPQGQLPTKDTSPTIKWPNDVLLNGRKLSGVLCESEFSGSEWDFAVVGFGVNVNIERDEFGPLSDRAGSLLAEWGAPVDRAVLLARILGELESLYLLMQTGQFGLIHSEWVAALETIGKQVLVEEAMPPNLGTGANLPAPKTRIVQGRAVRVDPDGALVVLTRGGTEQRVLAGDVLPAEMRPSID